MNRPRSGGCSRRSPPCSTSAELISTTRQGPRPPRHTRCHPKTPCHTPCHPKTPPTLGLRHTRCHPQTPVTGPAAYPPRCFAGTVDDKAARAHCKCRPSLWTRATHHHTPHTHHAYTIVLHACHTSCCTHRVCHTRLPTQTSGNNCRTGTFLDFVMLTTRTMHPNGAYVWRAKRNRIDPPSG